MSGTVKWVSIRSGSGGGSRATSSSSSAAREQARGMNGSSHGPAPPPPPALPKPTIRTTSTFDTLTDALLPDVPLEYRREHRLHAVAEAGTSAGVTAGGGAVAFGPPIPNAAGGRATEAYAQCYPSLAVAAAAAAAAAGASPFGAYGAYAGSGGGDDKYGYGGGVGACIPERRDAGATTLARRGEDAGEGRCSRGPTFDNDGGGRVPFSSSAARAATRSDVMLPPRTSYRSSYMSSSSSSSSLSMPHYPQQHQHQHQQQHPLQFGEMHPHMHALRNAFPPTYAPTPHSPPPPPMRGDRGSVERHHSHRDPPPMTTMSMSMPPPPSGGKWERPTAPRTRMHRDPVRRDAGVPSTVVAVVRSTNDHNGDGNDNGNNKNHDYKNNNHGEGDNHIITKIRDSEQCDEGKLGPKREQSGSSGRRRRQRQRQRQRQMIRNKRKEATDALLHCSASLPIRLDALRSLGNAFADDGGKTNARKFKKDGHETNRHGDDDNKEQDNDGDNHDNDNEDDDDDDDEDNDHYENDDETDDNDNDMVHLRGCEILEWKLDDVLCVRLGCALAGLDEERQRCRRIQPRLRTRFARLRSRRRWGKSRPCRMESDRDGNGNGNRKGLGVEGGGGGDEDNKRSVAKVGVVGDGADPENEIRRDSDGDVETMPTSPSLSAGKTTAMAAVSSEMAPGNKTESTEGRRRLETKTMKTAHRHSSRVCMLWEEIGLICSILRSTLGVCADAVLVGSYERCGRDELLPLLIRTVELAVECDAEDDDDDEDECEEEKGVGVDGEGMKTGGVTDALGPPPSLDGGSLHGLRSRDGVKDGGGDGNDDDDDDTSGDTTAEKEAPAKSEAAARALQALRSLSRLNDAARHITRYDNYYFVRLLAHLIGHGWYVPRCRDDTPATEEQHDPRVVSPPAARDRSGRTRVRIEALGALKDLAFRAAEKDKVRIVRCDGLIDSLVESSVSTHFRNDKNDDDDGNGNRDERRGHAPPRPSTAAAAAAVADRDKVGERVSSILWNLAVVENVRPILSSRPDVLRLLLRLSAADGAKTRKNALSALGNLAKCGTSRVRLVTHGEGAVVDALLEVVRTDDDRDARRRAARTLRCLAGGKEEEEEEGGEMERAGRRMASLRPALARSIVEIASGDADVDVRAQALETLALLVLSSSDSDGGSVDSSSIVMFLVEFMTTSDESQCIETACRAVSEYYLQRCERLLLRDQCSLLLQALGRVAVLDSCTYESKTTVAHVIHKLAGVEANRSLMASNVVFDGLAALLSLEGPGAENARLSAAGAVVELAKFEPNKALLVGHAALLASLVEFTVAAPKSEVKKETKEVIMILVGML